MDPAPTQSSQPGKNNTLALISMIFGIVGWALLLITIIVDIIVGVFSVATIGLAALLYICVIPFHCLPPIGWIVALVTGHIARNQIKQTFQLGSGQATAGLIMGWVGILLVVLGIILTILFIIFGVSIPIFHLYR